MERQEFYIPVTDLFARKGIEVRSVEVIGSGAGSKVCKAITDQGTFAVKIAMYPERRTKVLGEFEIRKSMIERGFDFIPPPHWIDDEIFPNGAAIFTYIEGKALERDRQPEEETLSKIAAILADLHTLDLQVVADGFRMAEELMERVGVLVRKTENEYPSLVGRELRDGIRRAFDEINQKLLEYRNVFSIGLIGRCHDDVAGNVVVGDDGRLWLVDWENSCVEDIVEEMVSVAHELGLPENSTRFLFDRYKTLFGPARDIDFPAMSRAYHLPTPICNICYSIDFLDVNLRWNIEPMKYADELVRVAESTKALLSPSISELLIQGAVHTREQVRK